MANYNFVVDSSFTPFSTQEMVMPLAMYKEAYEKDEERYLELQKQAGDFEYLSRTLPEDSQARKIYENYANDLKAQAEDFSHNGLSMKNRRALTALRGRYQGEIGQLVKADEAVRELIKLRRTQKAQDPSMIYAVDIPNIDDYLDGKMGNEFGISGASLDTAGAQMGAAISNRMYDTAEGEGNILGGYYKDYIQRHGIQNAADFVTTDEFKTAMMQDLKAKGVLDNLTGANLQRAIDSYVTGAMKGIVYQEQHNPQRDLGKIDAATAQQLALSKRGQDINLAMNGMTYDDRTGKLTYHLDDDPKTQQAKAIAEARAAGKNAGGGSKSPGSEYSSQVAETIHIKWNGNDPAGGLEDDLNDMTVTRNPKSEDRKIGQPVSFNDLPPLMQEKIQNLIGQGSHQNYNFYYTPFKSGGYWDDTEAELEIVPRKIVKQNVVDAEDINYSAS